MMQYIVLLLATMVSLSQGQNICLFSDPGNDLQHPKSHTQFQNADVLIDFYWDFSEDQSEVTMMLIIDKVSYFGFGLGSKMKNADIWVFEIGDGTLTATDCYSKKDTTPPSDQSLGGRNDLIVLGCKYDEDGKTMVKFKRKADTGDSFDKVLTQNESYTVIWAHGPKPSDKSMVDHKNHKGVFSFNFTQNADSIAIDEDSGFYSYHKWANLICWGILVDVAIMISRFWKTYKYRMEIHGILMVLIVLASFGVSSFMLYQEIDIFNFDIFSEKSLRVKWHFILGLLICIIILVQVIGGYILSRMIRSTVPNQTISEKPTIHEISGHAIYVFAKINVGIGIYLYPETDLIVPFWVAYLLVFFWRILVEVLYKKSILLSFIVGSGDKRAKTFPDSEIENFVNYVELKDDSQIGEDKMWCIFNNDIIDLTDQVHPGGQYIWKAIQGKEVSRYIYGAYALDGSQVNPYTHSDYALAMIKRQTIGNLKPIPFYFDRARSSSSLVNFSEPTHWWKLETVEPLSTNISYFGFKNEELSFRTSLNGIEAFGRYFLISSENKQISTRPYTMVLCMAKPNIELRKLFIKLADSIINKQQPSEVPVPTEACSELPFIIKRYESKNGFSDYIHQDNTNGKYLIQGPFGVSFGLPESGHFVIICGGTGLLPFLDLLDYFLKYTVYEALRNTSGEEVAQFANLQKLQFKKYRITMFLSVKNQEELIGKDIYFSILNMQKHLPAPNFNMILKANFKLKNIHTTTLRFDEQHLNSQLGSIELVNRFLICGPQKMMIEMEDVLKGLGVQENKIHLV